MQCRQRVSFWCFDMLLANGDLILLPIGTQLSLPSRLCAVLAGLRWDCFQIHCSSLAIFSLGAIDRSRFREAVDLLAWLYIVLLQV